MIDPSYFLVNHSRKEFWFFENKEPMLKILEFAVQNIAGWKITDEIYIQSECACYGIVPVGYKHIILSESN